MIMAELLSKDMLADLAINIVNILVLFFVTRALLYKPVKKYLAARKGLLTVLYPDQPDVVAQVVARVIQDKEMDLCKLWK